MYKVFYWSPYLSNVATIRNVINSAISLKKYNFEKYDVSLLDTIGEWRSCKDEINSNKLSIEKVNNLNLKFNLGSPEILKINLVLKLNIKSKNKGKDVRRCTIRKSGCLFF